MTDEEIEETGATSRRFMHKLWNLVVGLSLIPFAWIFTTALFAAFKPLWSRPGPAPFWKSHEFLMFALGSTLWLLWFCVSFIVWKRPRPLRAYILGHELMHMLVARISGGRIKSFSVSRDGGHIVTDKYNFLIALAPYLWPFYSVPVLAVWSVSFLYWKEAMYYRELFLGALGFTWMFHLTFTLWVLPKGQSDFHGPGRIFSLVLIYLANTILLSGVLIVLAPEVTWHGYGKQLWISTRTFYVDASHVFERLVHLLREILRAGAG